MILRRGTVVRFLPIWKQIIERADLTSVVLCSRG